MKLDIHSRYIYVGLLILASETNNAIVNDPSHISHRLAIDPTRLDLKPLFRSGLLLASPRTVQRMNCSSEGEIDRKEIDREDERCLTLKKVKRLETEWPEGFAFTEKHQALAAGLGLNVHSEMAKFRDRCQAKGSRYVDWHAAFRTWLNNAAEFKAHRSH
jgi:hypothetical protein